MALARALVLERDHAFRVGLVLDQRKVALREAAGEERDAFTEQNRNDAQVEFIDQVCLEEVAGQFPAAHEPDVFAGAFAELTDESGGRLVDRSEEHTSELQSPCNLVCRLLLEKKKKQRGSI